MSNAIFPTLAGLMWDVVKSPRWNTKVQSAVGGKELRAQFFSAPIWRWQLSYEVLRQTTAFQELQALAGFFNARQGKFDSFLFNDPTDNAVVAHGFGVGDGATTAFQLQRTTAGPRQLDFSGTYPVSTVPRKNLVAYSEDLTNAAWTKTTGCTVAAAGAIGPDGISPAMRVSYDGSGVAGSFRIWAGSELSILGQVYTVSIWLRADAPLTLQLGSNVAGTQLATVTTAWQRITRTVTGNGVGSIQLLLYSAPADNTPFAVYAFGAQIERAASAGPYIKTTGAAVTINPAFVPASADGFEAVRDLNGAPTLFRADWQGTQQLSPTPRTNVLFGAGSVGNTSWNRGASGTGSTPTVTAGQADPSGGTSGVRVQCSQGAGVTSPDFSLITGTGTAGVPGNPYTASVWLKSNTGANQSVYMSLAGTVPAVVTITPAYQRFSITHPSWPNTSAPVLNIGARGTATAGGTVLDLLAYGAQVEVGTAPTALILTTTTAVTVTDYSLSPSGLVTFASAPVLGAILTWSGGYYWRVRFDQDVADFQNFLYQLWAMKQLILVSVK